MAVMRKRPIDQAVLENAPDAVKTVMGRPIAKPSLPPEKPFPRDAFNPMDIYWTPAKDPTPRHK